VIDAIPTSDDSVDQIKETIISYSRKLEDLISRSNIMIEQGNLEEFQLEVSEIGHLFSRLSLYNIDKFPGKFMSKLQQIGKELHLVETMRVYMDGGKSVEAITDKVNNLYAKLNEIIPLMP
jgi:hypothetical protein